MENYKSEKMNILLLKSEKEEAIVDKIKDLGFRVNVARTCQEAIDIFNKNQLKFPVVLSALGSNQDGSDYWHTFVSKVRSMDPKVFIVIFSQTAINNPHIRVKCFDEGCNMVTNCLNSLENVLVKITGILTDIENNKNNKNNRLICPLCGYENLSEDGLWIHLPLYHINYSQKLIKKIKTCPLCKSFPSPNLQVHYRNLHGPCGRGETHNENQVPVKLYAFSLVVVHRKSDNKFLLVQEFGQSGYWLPGGRVDTGEDLQAAAVRETKEEAGIDIQLKGVLCVQFTHSLGRLRTIFYAEPIDDAQLPKSIPDYESVGASYVSSEEIQQLPLRGNEPLIWIDYVVKGNQIFPLTLLTDE